MTPEISGVRGHLAQRCNLSLHANSNYFTITDAQGEQD